MAVEDARYDDIGNLVLALAHNSASKIVLYVEFDDGVIGPSVFYQLGSTVYYAPDVDSLFDELERLQELFGPEIRAMEFTVEGVSFRTEYTYADRFDDSANRLSREDIVLRKHFGCTDVQEPVPQ